MAGKTRDLKIRFKALDRISKTMDRIKKKFPQLSRAVRKASRAFQIMQARTKRFRQGMMNVGRGLRSAGQKMRTNVSLPAGIAGAAIIKLGVDFQRSMNKVGAITGTVTRNSKTGVISLTKNFEDLKSTALKLGATTEFSANQAADAMVFLGRAGFDSNQIMEITGNTLSLASASGSELAFTADTMAKAIKQFGLEAEDSQRVADVLAKISSKANVSLETLAETFQDAGPIAKAYGATLEQTAAITGLLGDVGIQGSKAGTSLKNIFLKIAAPSARARVFMEEMGVAVTNMDGSMRSAGQILTDIAPKLGKLNKDKQLEVVNELFGLRGIAGASAIMSQAMKDGKDPIADMTKVLEGAGGTAADMQAIMQMGAVGGLSRFMSAVQGAGLALGENGGLLDAFTLAIGELTKFSSWLTTLDKDTLKWIVRIVGLLAVIGPLLGMFGMLVSGIAALTTIWSALSAIMIGVSTVAVGLSLPFIAIAAAVAIVVAGIARVILKWKELKKAWQSGSSIIDSIRKATSVFFTFGGKKEETKSGALGPAAGAKAAVASTPAGPLSTNRTNNAAVTIDLKGFPSGTKARSERDQGLDFNLGFSNGVL